MEKTNNNFISKLTKRSGRIERDREDIEREESDGEIVTDPLNDFRKELRRGLQDAADSCLNDGRIEPDERTQYELLRYELGKALAKSPAARKDYLQRIRRFQQRFEK
jgi:hypothetical protein